MYIIQVTIYDYMYLIVLYSNKLEENLGNSKLFSRLYAAMADDASWLWAHKTNTLFDFRGVQPQICTNTKYRMCADHEKIQTTSKASKQLRTAYLNCIPHTCDTF